MGEMPSLSFDDDDIRAHIPGADADLLGTWRFDLESFLTVQQRVRSGSLSPSSSLFRGRIEAPHASDVPPLPARDSSEARDLRELGLNAMARGSVGVVVLANDVPAGLVPVVDGDTFIDLKIADARRAASEAGGRVPVFVMTSFATHAPLERHLRMRGMLDDGDVVLFPQSMTLRLTESGEIFGANRGAPLPPESYATAGDGDFFRALVDTGAYARLRALGVETLVLSDVSNLGASLDPIVVGAFVRARDEHDVAMLAETVARDDSDEKNAAVVVRADGRLRAFAGARVPDSVDANALQSVSIDSFLFDMAKLANPLSLDVHLVPANVGERRAWQPAIATCEASALLRFAAVRVEREGRIGRFFDGRYYPVNQRDDVTRVSDLLLASRASEQPLSARTKHVAAAFRAAFGVDPHAGERAVVVSPGRVKLFGEHNEEHEGLVLAVAVDRGVVAMATKQDDGVVEMVSLESAEVVRFDVRATVDGTNAAGDWGRYGRAVIAAYRERGVEVGGMRIALTSDVPQHTAMSSSTTMCLAIAKAASELFDGGFSDDDLASIAHRAEHIAGGSAGRADAFAIAHGKRGRAMLIDCRAMDATPVPLALPDHVLLVADTGKNDGGFDQILADRRRECAEAVRVLSQLTGRTLHSLRDVTREDLDDVGSDMPDVLRARAEHVLCENQRVVAAAAAFRSGSMSYVGSLLNASHASLRDKLDVSSSEVDMMVDLLRTSGALGARMLGGHCALAVVERAKLDAIIADVDAAYRRACSLVPAFFALQSEDGVRTLDD